MFKNKDGKVRSGFNIFLALIAFFAMTIILSTGVSIVATAILAATGDLVISGMTVELTERGTVINSLLFILTMVLQEIVMIGVVWISWTKIMKKSPEPLGVKRTKTYKHELPAGLLMGFAAISIVFALIMVTGNAVITGTPHFSWDMLLWLGLFILVGIAEELFSRGYLMGVLRYTGNNRYVIFIVSMIIFALLHGANIGMSPLSFINLMLIGGAFSYMYYKSGNLRMCIGFHITWNFFQGMYGFPVSGLVSPKVFDMVYEKDTLLNGGAFGPEAGLFVTAVSVLLIACTHFYYRSSSYDFMKEDIV